MVMIFGTAILTFYKSNIQHMIRIPAVGIQF